MTNDRKRQHDFIIACAVLTAFSTAIVFFRIAVRAYFVRKIGWDDWSIIAAIIFTIGYFAELIVCKDNKIGFPTPGLSLENLENLLKISLSIQVTYYTIVFLVKVSILFLYLRFAVTRKLKLLCIYSIVLHVVFYIICLAVTLGQFRPLYMMWDITGTVKGKCINTTAFFYSTSVFNIITDIWILVLPIKTLYGIKRPRNEKIALLSIFGIGVFACIVSCIRLHSIYTYTLAEDKSRNALRLNLWSMIEVNVAILCASVPSLKPLFTPGLPRPAKRVTSSQTTRITSVTSWWSVLSKPR